MGKGIVAPNVSGVTLVSSSLVCEEMSEIKSKTATDIDAWKRQCEEYERQMARLRRASRSLRATQVSIAWVQSCF